MKPYRSTDMTDEQGRKAYRLIDKNLALNPVAYCRVHHGYLTKGLMKTHRCMQRQCRGFSKINCRYWDEKKKRKELSKQRKHQLKYGWRKDERV